MAVLGAGSPVHVGDLDAQTRGIYDFIGQVLSNAGASFEDLLRVKICFKQVTIPKTMVTIHFLINKTGILRGGFFWIGHKTTKMPTSNYHYSRGVESYT